MHGAQILLLDLVLRIRKATGDVSRCVAPSCTSGNSVSILLRRGFVGDIDAQFTGSRADHRVPARGLNVLRPLARTERIRPAKTQG